MRSIEQWEMVVEVERDLLSARAARRRQLGELPAGPSWWSGVQFWHTSWRPFAWLGRLGASAGAWLRGRGPLAGMGGSR